MTDKYLAGSIVDLRRQPILVSPNIENREFPNGIGMGVSFPHIDNTGPPRPLHDPIPIVERPLSVPVRVCKVTECLTTDDSHASMLSKRDHTVKG
jgi:hypothetical protein